jgi:restriction system protein
MVGEAVVHWGVLSKLNKKRYRVLKNIFVPSIYSCGVTELDHVVLSAHGIFVIETKNYGGWIFGSENDQTWTYTNLKKKYQFVNPLIQNQCHVASRAAFLGLPKTAFHSMVVFVGEAQIKTPMPPNVLTTGVLRYIESKDKIVLTESQLENAWERLSTHDAEMEKRVVRREHLTRLSGRAAR